MLRQRSHRVVLLVLTGLLSLYLLAPLVVSYGATQWLSRQGYRQVIVQLGYPGWQGLSIPVVSFQLDLGDELLMVSLTNVEVQYHPSDLLRGRVTRVVLPYLAIQMLNNLDRISEGERSEKGPDEGRSGSPWNMLTAGDLLRQIPVLPFEQIQLDQVTLFREQATGPLRKVSIRGVVEQRNGELGGHLLFQGRETASYGLTVAGHSATTWSATLVSQRPQAAPILVWQSTAQARDGQVQVEGKLDINVRELAPFIALAVPIGPELSQVAGHVVVAWTGRAPSDASLPALRAHPQSTFEGSFHTSVSLPALKGVAKHIALTSSGHFSGSPARLGWTLDPGLLGTATVNMQPRFVPDLARTLLPQGDQPLRIEQRQAVTGTLYWAESPMRLAVEGPVHVSYGETAGPLTVGFDAIHAELVGQSLTSAEGGFHLRGVLPRSLTAGFPVREILGDLHGRIVFQQNGFVGMVRAPSTFTAKQIQYGGLSASATSVHVVEPLPLQCALASGQCTAGPGNLQIRTQGLHVSGHQVKVAEGMLALQRAESLGASWTAQGSVGLSGVAIEPLPVAIPPTSWQLKFAANQAGLKVDVRGDVPEREGIVTAKVEHAFRGGEGAVRGAVGPLRFDSGTNSFRKMLPGLSDSWDLISGEVMLKAEMRWASTRSNDSTAMAVQPGTITLHAEHLSATLHDIAIQDISTTMHFKTEGLERLHLREPAVVNIASIQMGVGLTDLSGTVDLNWDLSEPWPVIDVKDLQCAMFGGSITSPGLHVEPAKPPHRVTLSLRRLDLARILSLEQQKGLHGTGNLNGTIPVTITAKGVSVKDGALEAEAPGGVIRYQPSSESGKLLNESDSGVKLVAQALTNFQYNVLRVGVQYAEDGLLQLAARLEGKNPDLKKAPPIHFNVTVQENIPALLKSLRLVQDIEQSLQEKVQRR